MTVRTVLDRAAALVVFALLPAIFFLHDGWLSASTVFTGLTFALAVFASPQWIATRSAWRTFLPYGAYLLVVACSWAFHPGEPSRLELERQGLFVLLIAGIAGATSRLPQSRAVALVCACLTLTVLQVLGPRSVVDYYGRAVHYVAIEQWQGYPEIGLLAAIGASGLTAVALTSRPPLVRLGAALLAFGFIGACVYLYSRSAMLTSVLVSSYLLAFAALRWRDRVVLLLLVIVVTGGVWLVLTDPRVSWRALTVVGGSSEATIRAEGWRVALAMLRDHPWMGVGIGRYPEVYAAYSNRQDSTHAYNVFLHVGAELGLVGLTCVVVLWGRVVWITGRMARRTPAGVAAFAVHGMLLAFAVRSLSEHFLSNLPSSLRLLMLLGVLFGLAEATQRVWQPVDQRER